jgi:hypothetical protein
MHHRLKAARDDGQRGTEPIGEVDGNALVLSASDAARRDGGNCQRFALVAK